MTPSDKNLPPLDEDLFDLLVDGELSEIQRRNLLSSLDKSPDGWRRCALAFLEAQCWKRDFCGVLPRRDETLAPQHPPVSAAPEPASRTPATRPGFPRRSLGTFLAIAASFLIALGIGTQIRPGWRSDGASGPQPPQTAGVAGPSRSGAGSRLGTEFRRSVQPVTLVSQTDPARSVQVPAEESDRWDAGCWHGDLPTVPDELLQALTRTGHEVRRSRQFVPVPLQDGRQLFVPVDQVDVRRNGVQDYQ